MDECVCFVLSKQLVGLAVGIKALSKTELLLGIRVSDRPDGSIARSLKCLPHGGEAVREHHAEARAVVGIIEPQHTGIAAGDDRAHGGAGPWGLCDVVLEGHPG